ncbi:MAG: hypothetical protein HND47_21045 [Chloroflexi bacterium]|nr:hypothetical protein [Chloroflexota bacterium]
MAGKKKNPYARYAFIGLIVALLACISTGLVASANALTGIGMFSLEETQQNALNIALQVSVGLLFIGLGVYAFLSPDSIRRLVTGRQARYGSNSLILILAFVGILVAVNYIVYKNQSLFGAPWDFTQDQSNTLSQESLQILATLPDEVTATAFYTDNLDFTSAEELLQKFKDNSNGKFDYARVNPDLNPVAAREAGITGDGKILLQMGDRKEIASYASETELVRTMIRLVSPEARAIYFLQGHGEMSLGTRRRFELFHRQEYAGSEELHRQSAQSAHRPDHPRRRPRDCDRGSEKARQRGGSGTVEGLCG